MSEFEWLSPREHALKRPDTYAGGTNPVDTEGYSFHVDDDKLTAKHERAMIAPAMLKILDEPIQNAMDRPDRKLIKITCDESGSFSVSNDGRTIPIKLWEKTDRYTAEILFTELMSGENFNDAKQQRLDVGGRNGLGIKITALMSDVFEVECVCVEDSLLFETSSQLCAVDLKKRASVKTDEQDVRAFDDAPRFRGVPTLGADADGRLGADTRFLLKGVVYLNKGKLRYAQRFEHNLATIHPPDITKTTSKDRVSSTTIRFKVDLPRLGMECPLDASTMGILRSRAYDVAACTDSKVAVFLDDAKLPFKGVKDYATAMGGEWIGRDTNQEGSGASIDVCLLARTSPNGYTVGFVNGIRCASGPHMDGVFGKLRDVISEMVSKKLKRTVKISVAQIRERLNIVVSARIINPSFTTQTKERLNTKADLVPAYAPSKATCTAFERIGLLKELCDAANDKEDRAVSKSVKADKHRASSIPKYERALKLGNKKTPCQLYITEGDSAKGLAVAGFSVIGRDYNGVFPLRGKLVNVNGMSVKSSLEHKEIHHLTQIMGLDPTVTYTAELAKALPYKNLIIFTDQDNDGSHIMGLVLNWLAYFYPTLLRAHPTFVQRFATPIVRARIGSETRSFFSQTEYKQWATGRKPTWVKYFKGLGTSTNEDAKFYFRNIDDHLITVKFDSDACKDAIDMWFHKQRAAERKVALAGVNGGYINYVEQETTMRVFCETELVNFGMAANERAIASVVDGLKPSQRKALFSTLSRKSGEVKVAQLAAGTAELTAYHHGEQSMIQTIVAMAQPWMGANNVALLSPNGMFGSRHMPREEHSAARYIFTEAAQIARHIFPDADNAVLVMAEDDGKTIEPKLYAPIVPLLLVNGTEGIGSGWRSKCPPYGMHEIIVNTRLLANDPHATLHPMTPSFLGFKGTVVANGTDFVFTGTYAVDDDRHVRITELPPKVWTGPYVEQLRDSMVGDGANKYVISIDDMSTTDDVNILLKLRAGVDLTDRDLVKDFDLSRKLSLSDLNFWDMHDKLTTYAGPHDIMRAHAAFRRNVYEKRRDQLIEQLSHDVKVARSKARFVREQNSNAIEPKTHTESELCALLTTNGYYDYKNFEYLRGMSAFSCTIDHADRIDKQADKFQKELDAVKATTVVTLWMEDLDKLEEAYKAYEKETFRKRSHADDKKTAQASSKKQKLASAAGPSNAGRKRKVEAK